MDHVSTWFQAALLPERWNVAGVSCGVLSVWHAFAMSETGNPYRSGGACDRDAAAALLSFCSLDYAGGKRLFAQPLHRARVVSSINRKLKAAEWTDIHAAICDYVDTCTRTPGHKQREAVKGQPQARSVAAPICWVLVDFLSRGDPQKIEAAWNTPYAVARCLFDARRDISGEDDSLESVEEEIRFDAYNKGAG